jgi:hypothetical protein
MAILYWMSSARAVPHRSLAFRDIPPRQWNMKKAGSRNDPSVMDDRQTLIHGSGTSAVPRGMADKRRTPPSRDE